MTMEQLIQETIAYLITCPMNEVEGLVQALRQVKVTQPKDKPAKDKPKKESSNARTKEE